MGVVYKLKDEVKEFIISEKRKNPRLSCRGLVDSVNKKFGVEVSKSSVNEIIKEAGLSSRVGRPPAKGYEKPIPKPKQPVEPEVKPKTETTPEEPLALPGAAQEFPSVPKKEEPVKAPAEPLISGENKIPDKPAQIPQKEEPQRSQDLKAEFTTDEIIDNLGFFFLKASQWMILQGSVLAEIIKPQLIVYETKDLEIKSDILLFCQAFGLEGSEAISSYDGKGLWLINNCPVKLKAETLEKFYAELNGLENLSLSFLNFINLAFSEAGFLKIILADNTVFYLDAKFSSVWQDSNIPAGLAAVLYQVKGFAKSFFHESPFSLNLFTTPGYGSFSDAFYEFIFACEGLPLKRMMRLSFHHQQKGELFPPLKLTPAKRYFAAAFWPWQQETKRFALEDQAVIKNFIPRDFDSQVFYSEFSVGEKQCSSLAGIKLRGVFLRELPQSPPKMGIITNFPEQKSAEEIISGYLNRWPNQEEGYQDFLKKSEMPHLTSASRLSRVDIFKEQDIYNLSSSARQDLRQNLGFLVNNLNNLCQRHFFGPECENLDFASMRKRFYSLSGQIERRGGGIFVRLLPAPGYLYQEDLAYAVKRVNESDIRDSQGNKLWFKLR